LPGDQVAWNEVDEGTAEAVLTLDGERIPVRLSVDAGGRLRGVAMRRWGDQAEDRRYALIPFGGDVQDERRFGDYTIPTAVRVGWWYGTDKFLEGEFFRAAITGAEFR
jgi:hypothetical protein